MRRVLELPLYRRLLCAYAANELAWLVGSLALAVLVYGRTGSALGATAFFLCSQFVPAFLSPMIVARLDQRSPRMVLSSLFAAQSLAALVLGLFANHLPLAPLLAIVTAGGVATLTARSLVRAITVGVIAPAGLLREGNALANTVFSICFFAGPALGGALVAADGTRPALLANAALLAVVAGMLLATKLLSPSAADRIPAKGRVRAAVAYARSRPGVRALLSIQAIALFFFTISIPVEVVFAEHSLHAGAGGYGALLSAWGGGAVAGSAIFARWRRLATWELIAIGAGSLGVGLIAMSLSPSLAVAIVGAIVAGAGNGIEAVSARTALQELVEQDWMAMLMSFNDSMFQFMPGLGIVVGGAIATVTSARAALAVAGIGAVAITAAVWVVLRPRYQRGREQRLCAKPVAD